jgi:RimJ/RimL family protein N-acetyltransferase
MITGDKVVLCDKTLDEARRDFIWQRDAELMALSGYPRLEETFVQYLTQCVTSYRKQPEREIFTIETLSDHEHIGNCSVYDVDHVKNQAQIGILIGEREYWDMGYGMDAVQTLVNYVFRDMGIKRIYLRTREDNQRARHCFDKCGFEPCTTMWQNGYHFIVMEKLRQTPGAGGIS